MESLAHLLEHMMIVAYERMSQERCSAHAYLKWHKVLVEMCLLYDTSILRPRWYHFSRTLRAVTLLSSRVKTPWKIRYTLEHTK